MSRKSPSKRQGRPKNLDTPKLFSTTLPTTVYELLSDIALLQRRTKSEILSDAIKAYARRFKDDLKPM